MQVLPKLCDMFGEHRHLIGGPVAIQLGDFGDGVEVLLLQHQQGKVRLEHQGTRILSGLFRLVEPVRSIAGY